MLIERLKTEGSYTPIWISFEHLKSSSGQPFEAGEQGYSLIGEVKNRSIKAFSKAEAEEFVRKAREVQEREQLPNAVLFVFSLKGFKQGVTDYFQEEGIAYSEDDRWLGE